MEGLGFLFAGYAAFWGVLGVYIVSLGWRQVGLQRQVVRLEQEMARNGV